MTKWTDWKTHDGSVKCPVPDGVRFQWQYSPYGYTGDSKRHKLINITWPSVARYRTRLPGKKDQHIAELEAQLKDRLYRCKCYECGTIFPAEAHHACNEYMLAGRDFKIADLGAKLAEAVSILRKTALYCNPGRYEEIRKFLETLK
jgi:hypothetical protein